MSFEEDFGGKYVVRNGLHGGVVAADEDPVEAMAKADGLCGRPVLQYVECLDVSELF